MIRYLTIDYGDEVLFALGMTPNEFGKEARILIAIKLYEMGWLSAGAAAELANLPKPLFLTRSLRRRKPARERGRMNGAGRDAGTETGIGIPEVRNDRRGDAEGSVGAGGPSDTRD